MLILLCVFLVGVTPIFGTSVASVPKRSKFAGVVIGKRYLLFPPATLDAVPIENFKVRVGSLTSNNGGKEFDIKGYVASPLYDPQQIDGFGRTGKYNRDNIAVVVVPEDLPIGRDNVEQVNLADANFRTEGPAYVLNWGYISGKNVSRTDITIHSKADCEATYSTIDCSRYLWGSDSDTCYIETGAPVFSGNTLIGTIASTVWCPYDKKPLFINSIPYHEKWIRQTIEDEELYVA